MKKLSLTFLLLVLFVLFGCSEGSSSSGDNAIMYWGESGGTSIALVIAEPSALDGYKAAYSPKTGHIYVIMVMSLANADKPASAGEVAISGNTITFKPRSDFGYNQASFLGTISNDYVTLNSIPGTSYTNVKVEKATTFQTDDTEELFGGDIADLINPSKPNNPSPPPYYPPSTDDDDPITPPDDGTFIAGRYVTNVALDEWPNRDKKKVYEGTKVDLTGMKVTVYYNTGDPVTKTVNNASEFRVVPPYYFASNGEHTLYYIAEYNTVTNMKFNTPQDNRTVDEEFVELSDTTTDWKLTGQAGVKYYDGYGVDPSGLKLEAKHKDGTAGAVGTTVRQLEFTVSKPTSATTDNSKVTFGSTTATEPRTIDITIPTERQFELKAISFTTQPAFKEQILFDDPRFFGTDKNNHWISHIKDGVIGLAYEGNVIKTIKTAEAFISNSLFDGVLTITAFPTTATGWNATPELALQYVTSKPTTKTIDHLPVPLFDTFVGIGIEGGNIVLNGNDNDDVWTFLKKVRVTATYQKGTNKNNTVKRGNIFVVSTSPSAVYFDSNNINGGWDTNIHNGSGGILTPANSVNYDKNPEKKLKAQFTYYAYDGGVNLSLFTPGSPPTPVTTIIKSATYDVGVTNY